jgi:hypothetical protein
MTTKTTKTSNKKIKYRSKLEERVAADLHNKNVGFKYEDERISYEVVRNYKPDFQLPNGIYVEAKGWFKSEDQRKMRKLAEQYPDKDFRMLFQYANGKVQGSKMTNIEWCHKYNYKWCESVVPQEWINEDTK